MNTYDKVTKSHVFGYKIANYLPLKRNILKKDRRKKKGKSEKKKSINWFVRENFSTHLYHEQKLCRKELSGPCLVAAVESV